MMRLPGMLFVCAVLPFLLAAEENKEEKKKPPAGWKEFTPKNKAYNTWFPTDGEIEETEKSINLKSSGQLRFFTAILERKDGSIFGISQVRLPGQLAGPRQAKMRQDLFRDLFVKEVKGKLIEEKNARAGTMTGKDYLIKTPRGMARHRLLGMGITMYRVIVIGTKEQVEGKDATTFIEAFRHIPFKTSNPGDKTSPSTGVNFDLAQAGGMVVAADGVTLIVSTPSTGKLHWFDTVQDKKLKEVEVEFQPSVLAMQGKKLFALAKGTSSVRVIDPESGKETRTIKVPGSALTSIACHPTKGPLYAANENLEVFSINPESGKVVKTAAKGQTVGVDPSNSSIVYTSAYNAGKDKAIVQELPGKVFRVELIKGKNQTPLMKYAVKEGDLKFVVGNTNAGSGNSLFSVSRDGKRIAMSGPYRPAKQVGFTMDIGVFDTADLETLEGKLTQTRFPRSVRFHPQLDLVATLADNSLDVFNAKSLVKKQTVRMPPGMFFPYLLTFGGKGTKVICCYGMIGRGGKPDSSVLSFHKLTLTDEQQAALKKAFAE
jgi:hypothetical protein